MKKKHRLSKPKILIGVTGSVAAIKIPELDKLLHTDKKYEIRYVITEYSKYFLPLEFLKKRNVYDDKCEWPNSIYQRGDEVLHIELRKWADLFLIAPCDANTLAKFAYGMCDNALTSVLRAWDPSKSVVIAPAMNTMMWHNPVTKEHLQLLMRRKMKLVQIGPVEKNLACGDFGMGAMSPTDQIADVISDICREFKN